MTNSHETVNHGKWCIAVELTQPYLSLELQCWQETSAISDLDHAALPKMCKFHPVDFQRDFSLANWDHLLLFLSLEVLVIPQALRN